MIFFQLPDEQTTKKRTLFNFGSFYRIQRARN
jgi:hypothetical protein